MLGKLVKDRKAFLKSIRGSVNSSERANSYALGWTFAIHDKVLELVPDGEKIVCSETGLVPVDMIKNYINNMNMKTCKPTETNRHYADEDKGRIDGEKVDIHKGLGRRKTTALLE